MKYWVFFGLLLLSASLPFSSDHPHDTARTLANAEARLLPSVHEAPPHATQIGQPSPLAQKGSPLPEVQSRSEEESELVSVKKRVVSDITLAAAFCVRTEHLSSYLRTTLRLRRHFSPLQRPRYLVLQVLRL